MEGEGKDISAQRREGRPRVKVVGLGPGPMGQVTLETLEVLRGAEEVLVRTSRHPCIRDLREAGVVMRFLDHLYENSEDLEETYRRIALEVVAAARERGEVVYATPGNPVVAERSVQLLLEEDVDLVILPAVSFLDAVFVALGWDPVEGMTLVEAGSLVERGASGLDPRGALLICQVDDRIMAAEVKTVLLEVYPPDHPVAVVSGQEDGGEKVEWTVLEELDRSDRFHHLASLFLPPLPEEEVYDFRRLVEVVARLRAPDGCPWDRKQTHQSLARHMVEEAHEAVEAISRGDMEHLCEELGDLLLQVVLHAQLGAEEGFFHIGDVTQGIVEKLVRRHPHVFGKDTVDTPEEVLARWERIKAAEKGVASLMDGISPGLPALLYAFKVQARAARVGFDWGMGEEVLPKLREEVEELAAALEEGDSRREEEIGDLLFTLVNISRHLRVDPEVALKKAAGKFAGRFRRMERLCEERGLKLEELSLDQMDLLWEEVKEGEGRTDSG
jgi:tetrapyrrole methylase family protein/MazG family protein